ncbi:hypothetical protein PIROE2DRAFT_63733 [Piromyces sp. E2]|nr:hypothetical protein PIROE2DRAFT_63733 [Piromyces sp. E2]|eukprot:OUM59510.1 hypothetical protein PIROE2DRAFT_63733 [Piromyces sp. E2]
MYIGQILCHSHIHLIILSIKRDNLNTRREISKKEILIKDNAIDTGKKREYPTTQDQTNQTLTDVHKLTEREIDRQRYARLKQQQQSIYVNRGRHNVVDGKGGSNHEVLHLSNLSDVQLRQFLMNNKNREAEEAIENNLLQASTSNANTTHSIAASQAYMNSISSPMNTDPKLNTSALNPMDFQLTNNPPNNNSGNDKNRDLYSQLLNSINTTTGKGKPNKEKESTAILSKTNDSRNREIAEKKKRRSAATMRCRERKKNQLQKKEQYIKYLENQILFLNGSILHMSNEITWLRRSFLDQYGEQSLKNIYMKNGFKDVNFSNILYPGSSPSPSSFASSNLLSPDMSLNGSPSMNAGQSPEQNKSSPLLPQPSPFLTPPSSTTTGPSNPTTNSLLTHYSPSPSSNGTGSKNSTTSSVSPQTMASLLQKNPTPHASLDMSNGFMGSYNASSHPTTATTTTASSTTARVNDNNKSVGSGRNTTASDLFNHLDMETLNEFANLTKEQRDVLLKILEKQKELGGDKPEEEGEEEEEGEGRPEPVVPPPTSRNFINIAHDHDSQSELSKPANSLLNLVSGSNTTPIQSTITPSTTFNPLTSTLLNPFNGQQDIGRLSFHSNSMAVAASHASSVPVSSLQTSQSHSLALHSNTTSLLSSFTTPTTTEKGTTTTTTNTPNSDYIDLENLIYYI